MEVTTLSKESFVYDSTDDTLRFQYSLDTNLKDIEKSLKFRDRFYSFVMAITVTKEMAIKKRSNARKQRKSLNSVLINPGLYVYFKNVDFRLGSIIN